MSQPPNGLPRVSDEILQPSPAPGVAARLLDAGAAWGGVLHAKGMIVDGRTFFLGSQNWDWRALEHIHELGVRVRHPDLARGMFIRNALVAGSHGMRHDFLDRNARFVERVARFELLDDDLPLFTEVIDLDDVESRGAANRFGEVAGLQVAHRVREQVCGEHQREHEQEGRQQRPPHHRFARQLQARAVDHVAPAVGRRINADADVRQHRLGQHQAAEVEHNGDQHDMHDIWQDMATDHAQVTDPEGGGRLDVLDLADLHGLATQQPAQAGPAGHAQDQAQEQQAQIGALGHGFEQLRMIGHIDLHHQDRRSDQQHAGNGVERRVGKECRSRWSPYH